MAISGYNYCENPAQNQSKNHQTNLWIRWRIQLIELPDPI